MSDPNQEIQKTLEEMKKRAEEFQAGGNSESSNFNSFSSSRLKLILTIVGVVVVLALSVFFVMKSGSQKAEFKAPPGYEIIYPKNEPPRLVPK